MRKPKRQEMIPNNYLDSVKKQFEPKQLIDSLHIIHVTLDKLYFWERCLQKMTGLRYPYQEETHNLITKKSFQNQNNEDTSQANF